MQNFKSISGESKVIVLLLVIFLFGLLILNVNRKKSCNCTKKLYEIPPWAVNLKKRNMEMFS